MPSFGNSFLTNSQEIKAERAPFIRSSFEINSCFPSLRAKIPPLRICGVLTCKVTLLNKRLLITEIHHPLPLFQLSGPCVQRRGWCRAWEALSQESKEIIRAARRQWMGTPTGRRQEGEGWEWRGLAPVSPGLNGRQKPRALTCLPCCACCWRGSGGRS